MTKEGLEKEAEVFATYYESLFQNEFETFYNAFLKVAEPREKRIEQLEKENAELKETVIKMNKVITETFSNLTKAKELLKKLKALYFSPVVTKDDIKRQDEILEEAEQFINENSTYERIQKAKYNYAD